MTTEKYIVEVRDAEGQLDFVAEKAVKEQHPYLFSKSEFTVGDLCYYVSYGQGRNNPSGPRGLSAFMRRAGVTYRRKYW